ncbi:MAG: hypothetical protein V3T58_03560 [Candidatus Hydrothermarchaeales archaeon]
MRIFKTKQRILVSIILIVALLILAWSPWITKSYAENIVISPFEESQKDIIDGCGFNCLGCGVTSSNKVLFGYSVDIEYGCGMSPYTQKATFFVSFLRTVHYNDLGPLKHLSNIQGDPFGAPPKGISPNCGPEMRYKFDVTIDSKDDFVDFIKNNEIDPWVKLDNFKNEQRGEVNWDRVLGSIKTDKIGSRTVYALDYYPSECSQHTLKMTNDGHVSVYGCCGK